MSSDVTNGSESTQLEILWLKNSTNFSVALYSIECELHTHIHTNSMVSFAMYAVLCMKCVLTCTLSMGVLQTYNMHKCIHSTCIHMHQ